MIDYGTSIELCTPHQPQQKGSVENLVGFVKRAFFRARRFQDLDTDLPQQLTQWLDEVNTTRPSRATGVPPAVRLAEKQPRLTALAVPPADSGLQVPVTVGPTAMVTYQGVRCPMPAKACGLPATLHLYTHRVRIVCAGGRLLELGPVGEAYVTELMNQRPHTWQGCIERVFAVLERLSEAALRPLLQRALMQRLFGAEYLEHLAAEHATSAPQEVAS